MDTLKLDIDNHRNVALISEKCRSRYYECKDCCDFNDDCTCDEICDKRAAPNRTCSYVPEVGKKTIISLK